MSRPLSTREASDLLGFHSGTAVIRLIHSGLLPAVKVSGRWVIDEDELIELLRSKPLTDPVTPESVVATRYVLRMTCAPVSADHAAVLEAVAARQPVPDEFRPVLAELRAWGGSCPPSWS